MFSFSYEEETSFFAYDVKIKITLIDNEEAIVNKIQKGVKTKETWNFPLIKESINAFPFFYHMLDDDGEEVDVEETILKFKSYSILRRFSNLKKKNTIEDFFNNTTNANGKLLRSYFYL